MNQDVRDELLALRKRAAKGEYVFVNPATGKNFTEIKRSFHTASRMSGIDNLNWHDLRNTFGTKLGDAGCAESTIAQLMGHASVQMAFCYRHGTESGKRVPVEPHVSVGQAPATILPQTMNGQFCWPR